MKNKLGVYVHVPFCNGKCYYCDFVSGVYSEDLKARYFASLTEEILAFDFSGYSVDTVYFGGGTPSAVDAGYISGVLDVLRRRAEFASRPEITLEGNPESLDAEKIRVYADVGVNRLSIGLQSANDALLQNIGRLHTRRDFLTALDTAQKRFTNISADMMLGLPGQTEEDVISTAKLLADRRLRHISAYALTVEAGTPLAESGYRPDDDRSAAFYDEVKDILNDSGFRRYEVSNFAATGYECRHNLKYWRREEYKGFGIAAHSFVRNIRSENTRKFDYLDGMTVISSQYIDPIGCEAAEEALMLALRTADGLDLAAYKAAYGRDIIKDKEKELLRLADYLEIDGGILRLTDRGFYVMNEIIVRLLS